MTYYGTILYYFCTKIFNTGSTVGYEYTQKYTLARTEKRNVVMCKKFHRKLENKSNFQKGSGNKDSQLELVKNEHANWEGGTA